MPQAPSTLPLSGCPLRVPRPFPGWPLSIAPPCTHSPTDTRFVYPYVRAYRMQLYNLSSKYGDKEQLLNLNKALQAEGIKSVADIVINHRELGVLSGGGPSSVRISAWALLYQRALL